MFEESTGAFVTQFSPVGSADPCSSNLVPSFPLPGRVVAEIHTHPMSPGDIIPATCTTIYRAGRTYVNDTTLYGGPSKSDIERLQNDSSYSSGFPGFALYPMLIVDPTQILKFPMGTNLGNSKNSTIRIPRTDATQGCTRP